VEGGRGRLEKMGVRRGEGVEGVEKVKGERGNE
jgi:hypothetical protein